VASSGLAACGLCLGEKTLVHKRTGRTKGLRDGTGEWNEDERGLPLAKQNSEIFPSLQAKT